MRKQPDYFLFGIIVGLVILGLVILSSVSAPFSQEKFGDTFYYLKHQIIFGLLPGLILGYLAYRLKLSFLKKWAPLMLLLNIIVLAGVFMPIIGSHLGGAARWVGLGTFSFQPSEFLKLTFILYLASWLTARNENINNKQDFSRTFFSFGLILAIIGILLYLQPNVSTLSIIIFIALVMYFAAKTPLWHTLLMFFLGGGGLFVLIKIAPYRLSRLAVFLNPETDPMGIGYQLKQALISVGSGGLGGVGLGMGTQKWGLLPEPMADSIFAVFAEELGLIGTVFLVLCFLLFLWRGIKTAKETRDKFSQLTVLGIVVWITIQSFVNMGAMIGLLPLTGIPLPFISYGGSALMAELVAMGVLLNISKSKLS